jgi:U3 small nucleolar RNA-associated protein 14
LNEDEEEDDGEDDSDEDEDLDNEEDDGNMINLSDMLGSAPSKRVPEVSSSSGSKMDRLTKMLLPSRLDEDEDEDDEEEDEDMFSEDEEDEDQMDEDEVDVEDQGKSSLADYVNSISRPDQKKRKRKIPEATEAYDESEFNLKSRDADQPSVVRRKLDIDDLLSTLPSSTKFGALKKQIEEFDNAGTLKSSKAVEDVGPENAPLAKRLQDRLSRQAAYQEANKEVSKWVPIVKKNREADQLVFPMNEPPSVNVTSSGLVGKFQVR